MNVLKDINSYKTEELTEILNKYDYKEYMPSLMDIEKIDERELFNAICNYLKINDIKNYAVLGIDIYKYSQKKLYIQTLIPYIFHALISEVINWLIFKNDRMEILFFEYKNESDFMNSYIDTGDGGFFIFQNPLLALSFAMTFAFILRIFNSYHLFPKFRKLIKDNITVRYTITMGKVYKIENKYYGDAIISNHRIMSKDRLNRCLIDENTYQWFMENINGIENLRNLIEKDYYKIPYFNKIIPESIINELHIKKQDKSAKTYLSILSKQYINTVDILKIDELHTKDIITNIYNLHIQFSSYLRIKTQKIEEGQNFCISLGNINIQGLK